MTDECDPLRLLAQIEADGDRRMAELARVLSAAVFVPPRRPWWRRWWRR